MRRISTPHLKQAQRLARTPAETWDEDWRLEMKADGEADEALEAERVEDEQADTRTEGPTR